MHVVAKMKCCLGIDSIHYLVLFVERSNAATPLAIIHQSTWLNPSDAVLSSDMLQF